MDIIFEIKDSTLIAALSGEIDHHVAEKMRTDIDGTMMVYRAKNLIFDFSQVTFMDSSGVGMVLGRYKRVKELFGKVVICGCDKYVEQILFMSGVFTLMEKAASKGSALAAIEEHEANEVRIRESAEGSGQAGRQESAEGSGQAGRQEGAEGSGQAECIEKEADEDE